jgi:hypothetical protein
MIIAITAAGNLELKEPDDFKGFKIVAEKPGTTDAEIAAALEPIATPDGDGKHYWVTQTAMKNWNGTAQSAAWVAAFDAMLEKVKKYGYVDAATGNVKGHIERV